MEKEKKKKVELMGAFCQDDGLKTTAGIFCLLMYKAV